MKYRTIFAITLSITLVVTSAANGPPVSAQAASAIATPFPVLVMTASPKPTPAPTPMQPDLIPYCISPSYVSVEDACNAPKPIIFIIGVAADPATRGKLIGTLADQLQNYVLDADPRLIPEPQWTPTDFATECKATHKSRRTSRHESAFVIATVATASGVKDAFSSTRTKSEAGVNLLYADCASISEPQAQSSQKPLYAYVWSSHVQFGSETRTTFNTQRYLAMVTALLGAATLYATFVPSKSSSTTTKVTFPTPPSPQPLSGWTSETDTTSTSQTNSGFSTLSQNLLTQGISGSSVIPVIPPDESQAWNAIEGAVHNIVTEMKCPKISPEANNDTKRFAEDSPPLLRFPAPFCAHAAQSLGPKPTPLP